MPRLLVAATATTLQLIAIASTGSGPPPGPERPSTPAVVRGAALPPAYEASAVLHLVARLHNQKDSDRRRLDGLLASIGLVPGSVAARGFVSLADRLETQHPYSVPDELYEAFGTDYAAARSYAEAQERLRFEALGDGLGRWLLSCERRGVDVELLLDRLLNGSQLSVSILSAHKSTLELLDEARLKADLFEQALLSAFGRVPPQLAWRP